MRIKDLAKTKSRYRTLCIDPPWNYDRNKRHAGKSPRNQATDYYTTMSVVDIEALPVERLAKTDAHMYLWVTNAFIHEGLHLMDAWGFRQVTMITWVKSKWGVGWHFRGQTEHMLFGVRGILSIPPPLRQPTVFYAPVYKHSMKPRKAYEIIETCSPERRLELFARRARHGWDSWGNEARDVDKELERDFAEHL